MAGTRKTLLKVEPSVGLEFFGPFTNVQTSTIHLENPTEDKITFKIKTTVPKRYCVRPSCGFVEPSKSADVAVMLQPFDCDDGEKNKHKFMIQSMILDGDSDANLEQVWKDANSSLVSDSRIKCTLRLPDDLLKIEPDELVFEGSPSESSSCNLTARNVTSKDVLFKVKTNAPKKYIVTPNEGIIHAYESALIKVATVSGVDSAGESRDRIALLSVLAPAQMPATVDQVWQTVEKQKISEKFLSCVFPDQDQATASSPSSKLVQLTQQIETLKKDNEELRSRQATLTRLGRETATPTALMTGASASGGATVAHLDALRFNIPPIIYLLVTFLFALAVGKFVL